MEAMGLMEPPLADKIRKEVFGCLPKTDWTYGMNLGLTKRPFDKSHSIPIPIKNFHFVFWNTSFGNPSKTT